MILIYLLLIILVIVLVIYCICFYQTENNSIFSYWFKGSKLFSDLDLENIIIKKIIIIKTCTELFNFFTNTLCHYDFIIIDDKNNYYIWYLYHEGDYYNRYIKKINPNNLNKLNNKLYYKHFHSKDVFWNYEIIDVKYNIKPISLKQIDEIDNKIFKFGYHISKFNCHHRVKMLINILSDKIIFPIKQYSILKTPYKILFELFEKIFK